MLALCWHEASWHVTVDPSDLHDDAVTIMPFPLGLNVSDRDVSLFTAVASRTAHSSNHGNEKAKQNLAEIFRPPHDLLFTGTFHEVRI